MVDKKEPHKDFSTCFEKLPFAELMRKMMGRQGAGSLCAEMMEKIMQQQNDGRRSRCEERMRKMMKECSGSQDDSEKPKEEVSHGRKES